MRIAALTLGMLGGVIALSAAGVGLALGGVGTAVGGERIADVPGGGWAALACSVLGLVGTALVMARPRLAGSLMVVAAIIGLAASLVTYVVSGPLLLVGGLLALLAKQPRAVPFAAGAAAALALIALA